jgi:hypothetical protein
VKTPESSKLTLMLGENLKAPGAAKTPGKTPWHGLADERGAIMANEVSGFGNCVGVSRGKHHTLNGWALLDFGVMFDNMANKKEK